MKQGYSYYMNTYMPNRVIRRHLSRYIYRWADKRYGVEARCPEKKELYLKKWSYWMRVKNKIFWGGIRW